MFVGDGAGVPILLNERLNGRYVLMPVDYFAIAFEGGT